ncbi:hypothetical protein A8L34_19430 [Bacillus sp. FJAT-27264]|uniref:hypothetical protein n=1 Tax=Paenibacillus sp. (strain DSM 101736 / FJAT-27264) TaxID=1850362 RepID=UPI000807B0A0|nr:hypothetical protein [Bacillus sp. FJAT-27264]OBZ10742.1 hypothetical protein A8L34_19430 [Bacillus sp. FJAT-27264]
MNKIGFTAKHHSNKYYLFFKLLRSSLAILLPIALTISIIYIMTIFPSHKAWIFANGSPQNISISNFSGRIDSKAMAITSKTRLNGLILNQQPLLLNINGDNFQLEPGDLQIKYGYTNLNVWDSIHSDTLIQFDMLDMQLSELNISKKYFLQRFNDLPSTYSLSINSYKDENYFTGSLYEKNFTLSLQGNLGVFIKKKKYESNSPIYTLNFTNPVEKQASHFQFMNFDNMDLMIPSEKGELMFTGDGGKSSFFFETGDLKFNQTTSEKQYSLNGKQLMVDSLEEEKLKIAYSLTRENHMEIYGNIKNGTLTGNSLFLTYNQWIIENMSTVLEALILTLLGLIIVKKSN